MSKNWILKSQIKVEGKESRYLDRHAETKIIEEKKLREEE
jgi:hypothetical protein